MRGLIVTFALLAPAGLHAEGTPDLTGVWMAPMQVHPAGFPMLAGSTQWAGISAGDPRQQHVPTMAEVTKRMDGQAESLRASHGDPKSIPLPYPPVPTGLLTETGKQAAVKFRFQDFETKELGCYPFNVYNRIGGGLGAMQVVQGHGVMMIATEINGHNFPRIIYLDGRDDSNALPSFEGYSVGAWHGDVLHVVTTHIKGDWFNMNWPLDDDARLTEDYHVAGAGKDRKLEILQRLEDPAMYREPLTRVSYIDWRPELELHDFPCEEGKADQVEVTAKAGALP